VAVELVGAVRTMILPITSERCVYARAVVTAELSTRTLWRRWYIYNNHNTHLIYSSSNHNNDSNVVYTVPLVLESSLKFCFYKLQKNRRRKEFVHRLTNVRCVGARQICAPLSRRRWWKKHELCRNSRIKWTKRSNTKADKVRENWVSSIAKH